MRIAIGSDHAGIGLKEKITEVLTLKGIDVRDFGTATQESVDYPDYGIKVAKEVSEGTVDRGVLICGTGIGMSIVANKLPRVRAALCHDHVTAQISRQHNDANILVLGGRLLDPNVAQEMVETWLDTPFEGGRHQRRVDKILAIEQATSKRSDTQGE